MSESIKNSDRITPRIPSNVKETLKKADRVLEAERTISLSQRDADTVFSLLENPPPPNERLRSAAEKHRKFFRESH